MGFTGGGLSYAAVMDGEQVGFDIELAQRFAAHLGREAKFSDISFGGLIAAAASGKVEMIVAASVGAAISFRRCATGASTRSSTHCRPRKARAACASCAS